MNKLLEAKCRGSAVWAAYGDSLGFITELADSGLVKKRYGNDKVSELKEWKKRIGGRMGAEISLPQGCYSDDTQLRLSTSRSISSAGYFDVESFAKIELPVWLSYALGAGRGTKEAASNLIRRDVNWFSNFFNRKDLSYFDGGGNGAAMRIQPHVWAGAGRLHEDEIILDVIRNSITTHGHPRGFLGAAFHAKCLYICLMEDRVPGPSDWFKIVGELIKVPVYFHRNLELRSFWLPAWEAEKKESIKDAVDQVQGELNLLCEMASEFVSNNSLSIDQRYNLMVAELGGLDPSTRGSGTVCAVLSSALAWLYRDESPHGAMVLAANLLSSDTDSIATMAGAILGAVRNFRPDEPVLDQQYIEQETYRICQRTGDGLIRDFNYPDVSSWRAPKSLSDALVEFNGEGILAGLGGVDFISSPILGAGKSPQMWQWCKLKFGQTVLVKRQQSLPLAMDENRVLQSNLNYGKSVDGIELTDLPIKAEQNEGIDTPIVTTDESIEINLDELSSIAIKSGFDEALIGRHILLLIDKGLGIEFAIAYSAIIAKARISRNRNSKK